MGLLDKTAELDGRRVLFYPWEGKEIRVRDDAETALTIIELLNSGENSVQKLSELVSGVFYDVEELLTVEDTTGLISHVCWDCLGLDITGEHKSETSQAKVIDWEQDADYIETTLLMGYGLSWSEAKHKLSYKQLCSLLGMAPHDTPMGQALYYRTSKQPERTKYNQEEVRHWRELREFWSIKPKRKSGLDGVNERMNDAFDALERLARS